MINEGPGIRNGIALYPSKKKVTGLLVKIKDILARSQNRSAFELINQMNPVLRG